MSRSRSAKSSPLLDTRVIYCRDNLDQLQKLPEKCIDLIYIDPPFNSNRNYEVFWGETKEKRASKLETIPLPKSRMIQHNSPLGVYANNVPCLCGSIGGRL